MKSTAGNLQACISLAIMYLLCLRVATVPICNVVSLVEKFEKEMKDVFHEYKVVNGANGHCFHKFPQLHFNSTPELQRNRSAICGINYVAYALKEILKYQEVLNYDKKQLIGNLALATHRVKDHVKPCLQHVLKHHENCIIYPEFPAQKDTYKLKQWGCAALNHSLQFLDQLLIFLKSNHITMSTMSVKRHFRF
ncbi:hypothetical protein SRHO_G00265890 [Serrasalmus rhombeus]